MSFTISTQLVQAKTLQIELSGVIDESVDFFKLVTTDIKKLVIVCRKVSRINSAGVRACVRFFHQLRTNGTELRFRDLSSALMELNETFSFIEPSEIESFLVPLFCSHCKKTWIARTKMGRLVSFISKVKRCRCPKCQDTMMMDVGPAYFDLVGCQPVKAALHFKGHAGF